MTEPKANGKRSIYCPAKAEDFKLIFDNLMYGLSFAGGDGDVGLFLRYHNYKDVVELFKNYELKYNDDSMRKMTEVYEIIDEMPDRTIFSTMNESVTIGAYDKDTFNIKNIAEMVIIH